MEKHNLRYRIIERSTSKHCCFDYTIIDTTIEDKYFIDSAMCECFNRDEAILICYALNNIQDQSQNVLAIGVQSLIDKFNELYNRYVLEDQDVPTLAMSDKEDA